MALENARRMSTFIAHGNLGICPQKRNPKRQRGVSLAMDTLNELHAARGRFVRAQIAEKEAIRELNEFVASGRIDEATLKSLLDAVQVAQQRSREVYEKWNALRRAFREEATRAPEEQTAQETRSRHGFKTAHQGSLRFPEPRADGEW